VGVFLLEDINFLTYRFGRSLLLTVIAQKHLGVWDSSYGRKSGRLDVSWLWVYNVYMGGFYYWRKGTGLVKIVTDRRYMKC